MNSGEKFADVFVAVLYHSKKGDVFSRMLQSLAELDYPPEKMTLCFIDNYSRDGAFELCCDWIKDNGSRFGGVIHIRAHGQPSRLRNIGLRKAMEGGFKYFFFIESDILVDRGFIERTWSTFLAESRSKAVFSISAVWDVGKENLDWLEKKYVKWLRGDGDRHNGLGEGDACNTSACLIDLSKVRKVGWFDEDIRFIEDLDWGRRATRKGYVCLLDSRVVLQHLRKYSLREMRKYFLSGALSEAKLFLKNGLALRVARRVVYWTLVFAGFLAAWINPIPVLLLIAVGYGAYFRRARGLGKLLLYPVSMPFNIIKSLASGVAMLYWLVRGGYKFEKVTVLGEPDWEVVLERVHPPST